MIVGAANPGATGPAVIAPDGMIALVAPTTLDEGMLLERPRGAELALATLGVPVMLILTSVLPFRNAVPVVSPLGRPVTKKSEVLIELAYVPLLRVYET